MSAQAKGEGRFLGGRPPYGYLVIDQTGRDRGLLPFRNLEPT